jgi:hypothetical protein
MHDTYTCCTLDRTTTYIEVVVPRDALHLDDGGEEHQGRHEEGARKSRGDRHGHALMVKPLA